MEESSLGENKTYFCRGQITGRPQMSPMEDELAEAYQANAGDATKTNEEWAAVSTEANQNLGELPRDE
jgi:hypothetical protein